MPFFCILLIVPLLQSCTKSNENKDSMAIDFAYTLMDPPEEKGRAPFTRVSNYEYMQKDLPLKKSK